MTIRHMTANTLNALKGWPTTAPLDFTAPLDPTTPAGEQPVLAGSVMHLTSSYKAKPGVGNAKVMPLFTFNSSDDWDVVNDGGDPATDPDSFVGGTPSGGMLLFPASGAYEFVSTAFVSGQTYNPNTPLTSPASGTANAGKLTPGVMYTNMIVGLVSRGIIDNGHGRAGVAFWCFPVFPTA